MAEIQNDYEQLGMQLLKDSNGVRVKGIETHHHDDPLQITVEILQQWLKGSGRLPVTWETLIACLQDAKLNVVAGYIEDAVSRKGSSVRQQQPSTSCM